MIIETIKYINEDSTIVAITFTDSGMTMSGMIPENEQCNTLVEQWLDEGNTIEPYE